MCGECRLLLGGVLKGKYIICYLTLDGIPWGRNMVLLSCIVDWGVGLGLFSLGVDSKLKGVMLSSCNSLPDDG